MNLKDFGAGALQVLKTVAPTIADTLAGPFAPLVDPIMQGLFGTSDPKKVSTALLNATPDQIIALKTAENSHIERLAQLGIDRDKLVYDDIANARGREIATKDPTPRYIAYLVTLGFFCTLGYLIVYGKPSTGGDVMLVMVGALGTAWSGIMQYYFGSSAGSAAKTDILANVSATAAAK